MRQMAPHDHDITSLGTSPGGAQPPLRLAVDGMDCASCAMKIERAVGRVAPGAEVSVNVPQGIVRVEAVDATRPLDRTAVTAAITALGYSVAPAGGGDAVAGAFRHGHDNDAAAPAGAHDHGASADAGPWWQTAKARMVGLAGGALALATILDLLWPAAGSWPFVAAALIGLVPVARSAIRAARAGSVLTIEMLMTIAAVGALAIDAAGEAATVVFLFAVGEMLEGVAASRARRGIRALADLVPRTARRIGADGRVAEVPAAGLVIGDRVLVRPGDRMPADGRIIEGAALIDESPVNGESVAREKGEGDDVFAGTVVQDRALTAEVTAAAADNTIARIIRLVEEAQESKAPVARFIDRFARVYMPVAVGLALATAVLPPLVAHADWTTWIYRGLTLLLISCPCALVISTPAAIAAGLAAGARRGLLIKGGAVLEGLAGIRMVAFDKTGTLTEGRPRVVAVTGFGIDEGEVVRLAAALETGASHPIARAILDRAILDGAILDPSGGLDLPQARAVTAIAGRGLSGEVEGRSLLLGAAHGLDDPALDAAVLAAGENGWSIAVLSEAGRPLGLIAMEDAPRADARAGLDALAAHGVQVVMLTGDTPAAAAAAGRALRITAHGGLLPEDKARIVREMQAAGQGPVAKLGDGINDAPALAAATVGIAMGGGTDVALETADAALLESRVGGVADLIVLARRVMAVIRQNVAIAIGLKLVFLATTIIGLTGMWPAILADTGATVLVTANALRLLRRH
ncbi:ATPase [Tistrella bauzanensis]|uniref:P-type Zn(2+) transporter n=1 Tax=Tistrella bauzanensis TaxID=657419 RepID=A0ABQ1IF91_9PROT|nr:heavy metal translocating P-type ATPase [Tistrella bauzanensis]GGB35669.1 ATPase [Tistrella bauzanensis]